MKIKICGLYRDEDIDFVNNALPDYIGFVFFKKSHRNISPARAAQLKSRLDKKIKTVGVFVDEPYTNVVQYYADGILDLVQLHGSEDNEYIKNLQALGCEVWKAFKIRSDADIASAINSPADMLVLDNGMGTGESFDWTLLSGIKRSFFLAGGINCENIAQALSLAPYGIDVSSGVETNKIKDKHKIDYIVRSVRNG